MSTLSSTALVAALAFSIATLGGAGCDRREASTPSSIAGERARSDGAGASCVACGGSSNGVLLAQGGPPVPGPTPTPGPPPTPTPGPVPTPTPPPTPPPPPVPSPPPPVPGPPVGGSGGARSASADPFALPTVVQMVAYR